MDDPRIDALIEHMAALTGVVGQLAQVVAAQTAAPAEAAPRPPVNLNMTQDSGYAPLAGPGPDNERRRWKLAKALGYGPSGPELDTILEHGARGYYRKLERPDGVVRLEIPLAHAHALIADAELECPLESKGMGMDLCQVWDLAEPGDRAVDAVRVEL